MKSIVVDDDNSFRLIIEQFCNKTAGLQLEESFSNAMEAIKFLNANTVDLIFLDIHMPSFSGFDFIQTLKNPPKVILTTSDKDFALQAFEYPSVVDYLVKPIEYDRFLQAVEKSKQFSQKTKEVVKSEDLTKELYVNVDRRLVKIAFNDINLIEAKGDYIKIKTKDKNYLVHSTLKKIEEKLPESSFLKIHRSYIINLSKIVDIEDNSVLIAQDVIPISRSNKVGLLERLNLL